MRYLPSPLAVAGRIYLRRAIGTGFALVLATTATATPILLTDIEGGGQSHDNPEPSLAINFSVKTMGTFDTLGDILMFAGNFAPAGYLQADGQLLSIASHTALFSQLGTTYGGDGRTTFALPDLRGLTPIGAGQGPGRQNYQLGQKIGEDAVTLTEQQLPSHSHDLPPSSGVTGDAGGDEAHQNIQPSLALNFTQRAFGTFPSRNGVGSSNEMVGQVGISAKSSLSSQKVLADGQLLPTSGNEALFSLLGTTYGGDGRTTFGLPDLRGRSAIGEGAGPGLTPRLLGQTGGQETVTLTPAELPPHAHGTTADDTASDGGGQNHENMQPFQVLNYMIALEGLFPGGTADNEFDPYLGEISMFSGDFIPSGWAPADGQLLPISQNQALFSLLGTLYGGDGRTTFALPDLRGRTPVHHGSGPGLLSWRLGQERGAETASLSLAQIASHDHSMPVTESVAEPGSLGLALIALLGFLTSQFLGGASWLRFLGAGVTRRRGLSA